jgi:predicted kinase
VTGPAAAIGPEQRCLVLVSGPPASGKTTIAVPLAAELGFALLAKDRIKETLHDWLAQDEPDVGWSRRLGAASMELLWRLAADTPAVVLEANFWPDDPRVTERLAALAVRPVEVFCKCPAQERRRRYVLRASARHVVHVDSHSASRMPVRRLAGVPCACPDAARRSSASTDCCGASTTETASASGAARSSWPGLCADVSATILVSPMYRPCAWRAGLARPFALHPGM